MERNCDNCKYRDVYYMAPPCDECNFEYQRQPQNGFQNWEPDAMTNADRIRAMSDEELAEVLDGSICPQGYNQLGECEASKEICHTCWIDWLKHECE